MSLAGGPRPHRLHMQVPEEQHEGPKEAPEVVVPVDVTLLIQFYVPENLEEKSNRKQRASRSCGTRPAPGHQASLRGGRERVGLADARGRSWWPEQTTQTRRGPWAPCSCT